jgi:uncharacterized protein (AIM24 family)
MSAGGWEEQPPIKDMARIQLGDSQVQIVGGQVPVADFALAADEWIYFSPHLLLWSDAEVRLDNLPGDWARLKGGLPVYLAFAVGPGRVGLSVDHLGEMIALPLMPGQAIWVREQTFLAATATVTYTFERSQLYLTTFSTDSDGGGSTDYEYPVGQFGDVFSVTGLPGLVLVQSPGNTFVRDLADGEEILIRPGALLYKDLSVQMNLHREQPNTDAIPDRVRWQYRRYLLLRLWGPGRVAVQSTFDSGDSGGTIHSDPEHTVQVW